MVDLTAIDALPAGGQEFFLIFTRCEYALKASEYFLEARDHVKADWDTLALELGAEFLDHVRRSGRATTLLDVPPKKQVVADGRLAWREVPPVRSPVDLFHAVRRVRNNLVHGGKAGYPDEDPAHNERGRVLISEARWVLLEALERNADVRLSFETYRA